MTSKIVVRMSRFRLGHRYGYEVGSPYVALVSGLHLFYTVNYARKRQR